MASEVLPCSVLASFRMLGNTGDVLCHILLGPPARGRQETLAFASSQPCHAVLFVLHMPGTTGDVLDLISGPLARGCQ